eukprot:TRINITY_DN7873_c0_g1_i2.p1 TRINITY_DN7873_c0_g1~~TRINITY_DN7873_c0_g1_i2.p1  ORF type:complete len:531 (+),score=137.12 TRINITY_DN7873_c0_g1_i2:189-1595(+)
MAQTQALLQQQLACMAALQQVQASQAPTAFAGPPTMSTSTAANASTSTAANASTTSPLSPSPMSTPPSPQHPQQPSGQQAAQEETVGFRCVSSTHVLNLGKLDVTVECPLVVSVQKGVRPENGHWAAFRRNHLQLCCHFEMAKTSEDKAAAFVVIDQQQFPLQSLLLDVWISTDNLQTAARLQFLQQTKDHEITTFTPVQILQGAPITFSRLLFPRATKRANSERFTVVVAVFGVYGEGRAQLLQACASEPLVVHGSHPGKLVKHLHVRTQVTRTSPTTTFVPTTAAATLTTAVAESPLNASTTASPDSATYAAAGAVTLEPPGGGGGGSGSGSGSGGGGCGWIPTPDGGIARVGPVGINVAGCTEAFTVGGNALITGSVLHTSDQRVKTDLQEVDTAALLEQFKHIKVRDYTRLDSGMKERGVVAQELAKFFPGSVVETKTTVSLGCVHLTATRSHFLIETANALTM